MNKIEELRQFMQENNLDYFLVPSTDEYLNEFVEPEYSPRYHISGFSGSTGDVLLSKTEAFLFVDGRYHKQADDEANKATTVIKLEFGQSQRNAIKNILQEKSGKLGIIAKKISHQHYQELAENLPNIEFVGFDFDPIIQENTKRKSRIYKVKNKMAGLSADEKLSIIQEKMDSDIIIVTALDEISYLTNLRSDAFLYNSCIPAKAIIEKDRCLVFSNLKLPQIGKNFEVLKENEFFEYLKMPQKTEISKNSINLQTREAISQHLIKERAPSIISELKGIKNSNEIAHLKKCFKKTDKALKKIQRKLKPKHTQQDLNNKTSKYLKKYGAKSLSFATISASAEDTAIVHFTHPSNKKTENSLILLDCGGYFKGGYATDITQTFWMGPNEPSNLHKKIYTIVLKGFLAGINYQLSETTTGKELDNAVRTPLDEFMPEGFSFPHSTGHGIGILVHEAIPCITPSLTGENPLQAGMVFSIEPGLYKPNEFGVRLERVVYITEENTIEPLSTLPFDEKLIDYNLLNTTEIEQLRKWQNQ